MTQLWSQELSEAEELLADVASWSEAKIARLPWRYREAATKYRRLAKTGEPTVTSSS